ncbi:MAG: aminopeptidase P family protein [archaeon]|nr:aminopeptidase P family protein [archaeon]
MLLSWSFAFRSVGFALSRSGSRSFHPAASKTTGVELAGQPTHQTHPHLIAEDEVVAGISLREIRRKRESLVSVLPPGSVAIFSAADAQNLAHDIHYRYRQDPSFLYLTGCQEPEAHLVLEKPQAKSSDPADEDDDPSFSEPGAGGFPVRGYRSRVYVRPRDPKKELWDGPISGPERARWMFGADAAYPNTQLGLHLPHLLQKAQHVYLPSNSPLLGTISSLCSELGLTDYVQIHKVTSTLDMQRVFKTKRELSLMQASAKVTAAGFDALFRKTKPGMMEYQLYAQFEYDAKSRGAQRLAYPPVIASGSNANILHYVSYDMPLTDGDLVLVDAGSEYAGYCSDVTRTFPVNGKFSPAQKALYEHVLRVQQKCISLATANSGNTLNRLQKIAVVGLVEALVDLGIIRESVESALENQSWTPYYPHNIGHYLGMDTHDTPSVSTMSSLRPGMVITVEPGLYIPDLPHIPEEFRGIGIRIEDDVYIDEVSNIVLTAAIPKTVSELEAIIGSEAT